MKPSAILSAIKRNGKLLPITLVVVLIPCMLIYFSLEVAVTTPNQGVKISGIYGEEIQADDILQIELVKGIPPTKMRTNGYSLGETRIGYFKTTNNGIIKLFLYTSSGPFLKITQKNGCNIYVGYNKKQKTQKTYERVMEAVGKK